MFAEDPSYKKSNESNSDNYTSFEEPQRMSSSQFMSRQVNGSGNVSKEYTIQTAVGQRDSAVTFFSKGTDYGGAQK